MMKDLTQFTLHSLLKFILTCTLLSAADYILSVSRRDFEQKKCHYARFNFKATIMLIWMILL